MTYWQLSAILVFLTAFLASSIAYPFVLRFAKRHNIVDNPDARKTHLHHLFIDMGFSHLGAALSILTLNLAVVGLWYLSWKLGASINLQAYIVTGLGFLVTFVFYKVMKIQQNGGPLDEEGYPQGTALWHWFCYLGVLSHREKGRVWRFFRWLMDTRFMSRARLFRKK